MAIPLFGNGLQANVTSDGRLINVVGSPVSALTAPSTSPGLNASQAIAAAKADTETTIVPVEGLEAGDATHTTTFRDGATASLVLFQAVGGTRLAWKTMVSADQDSFLHVIDAQTGGVLYRRSLVNYANPGHASVWEYYPAAPLGGSQHDVDLTAAGWLPAGSTTLTSNNAHVYTDINDDDAAQSSEESRRPLTVATRSRSRSSPRRRTRRATTARRVYVCSWRSQFPQGSFSWQTNRSQNATQVFYYVNKFHDHLLAAPIGFTEAAGNFQTVNSTGQGLGGDAIQTEPIDGANTLCCVGGQPVGLPNSVHVDNANMGTPPDGQPPRMQMYLFHYAQNPADPFVASNGGDDADVVYHEYTHGLSNRLVVDADGQLDARRRPGRRDGRGLERLVRVRLPRQPGLRAGHRPPTATFASATTSAHGLDLIRTSRSTARSAPPSPKCHGGTTRPHCGPGGYTYGDYGQIHRASPRCTPTARSGARRCGTCARRSART